MARPKRPSDSQEKRAEYRQRYKIRHHDIKKARDKAYRLKNLDKIRDYQSDWYIRWKSSNPDKYRQLMKEQAIKHRPKRIEYGRKYRKERPEKVWAERIKREHGLTAEQYYHMLEEQHGVCYICLLSETRTMHGKVVRLVIDHNHQTGQVRRLLCHACNVSVGLLQENPDRMRRMAQYIEQFNPQRILEREGGPQ